MRKTSAGAGPLCLRRCGGLRLALGPALAVAAVLPGGCNVLGPLDSDLGDVVDESRLREIQTLTLVPASDEDDEAAVRLAERLASSDRAELSIEECRVLALRNNLQLRAALVDPAIANEDLSREEAAFEAALTVDASWRNQDSATSSSLVDAQSELQALRAGVNVPLRTGGRANVTIPLSRSETNNQFSTLNPAYTSDLDLSLSQPLLRDAGRFASTYGIRIASIGRQSTEARTKLAVMTQLIEVDRAYWSLYRAREELVVRQEQLELSQAQRDRARRRVDAGQSAEIEVVRAEAAVASSLDAILQTESLVLSQQRELKRLVNATGLEVNSVVVLVPTSPPDPVRYRYERETLLALAMDQRMDLLAEELALAGDRAGVRFAENQALPALALTAGYTINGLGESLGDSLEQMAENRFEDWSIGAQASVPLGNERALASLRRAALVRLQRISTVEGRRQTITQQVLNAIDRLEANWQRIIAAAQSVAVNRRALEAEQRQFDVGRSTSTDVLDATSRLSQARLDEIRAIVEYQLAQLELASATGTLLGQARVRWEPVPRPRTQGPWIAPKAEAEATSGTEASEPD